MAADQFHVPSHVPARPHQTNPVLPDEGHRYFWTSPTPQDLTDWTQSPHVPLVVFDPHRPTDVLVCDHIMTPRVLHLNEVLETRNPKSLATSSICLGLDREDPDTARRGMSLHDDDREFVEPGFRSGRNTKYRHRTWSLLI